MPLRPHPCEAQRLINKETEPWKTAFRVQPLLWEGFLRYKSSAFICSHSASLISRFQSYERWQHGAVSSGPISPVSHAPTVTVRPTGGWGGGWQHDTHTVSNISRKWLAEWWHGWMTTASDCWVFMGLCCRMTSQFSCLSIHLVKNTTYNLCTSRANQTYLCGVGLIML